MPLFFSLLPPRPLSRGAQPSLSEAALLEVCGLSSLPIPVGPGAQDWAGVGPYDSLNTLLLLTVLPWNKYLLGDLGCMTVAGYVYGGYGGRG